MRFTLIEEYDIDGNFELAYYDSVDHESFSFADERFDKLVLQKLNKLHEENEELKQLLQDFEDSVNNFFLENEHNLKATLKQQAHLELGVEFEYDF